MKNTSSNLVNVYQLLLGNVGFKSTSKLHKLLGILQFKSGLKVKLYKLQLKTRKRLHKVRENYSLCTDQYVTH